MKQATYNYTDNRKRSFHCVVTLKNDGKISHSLPYMNQYNSSAAMRYEAKQLGKAIVALNWEHPAVKTIYSEDNSKLIFELKNHTQDLKEAYLEQTEKYVNDKYHDCLKVIAMTGEEKLAKWGVTNKYQDYSKPRIEDQFGRKIYQTYERFEISSYGNKVIAEAQQITGWGYQEYLRREIKNATEHYEDSINKLAKRLKGKGITDETKFTVKSGRIGMNFECLIFHEGQVTKAWTIIASGPIQRPHYRYLVK